MNNLLTQGLFALFFVITVGLIIGRIKVRGFSLDMSAVIFIALFLGYMGIEIPTVFKSFGLLLFIFTVGMQSGPGFFNSFLSDGRKSIFFVTLIVLSGVGATFLYCWLFGIKDSGMIMGLFTGGMASSIGLAAASDVINSPLISIGYSIAYPFALLACILFFQLLPVIMQVNFRKEEVVSEEEERTKTPILVRFDYKVTHLAVNNKTISELDLRARTQCNISRIKHKGETMSPSKNTKIFLGDILRIVGPEYRHKELESIIGNVVEEEDMDMGFEKSEVIWILVTNKAVVGKSLAELNMFATFNSTVVRIRRAGIDLPPNGKMKLRFGDRAMISTTKANESSIIRLLGNNDKLLSDTDFLPITLGIILGIILGNIAIPIGPLTFKLGLSGGVLITALVLSAIGKTGPIIWSMSSSSNILFRELGLLLFTAAVGTEAGAHLSGAFNEGGVTLVIIGILIALTPLLFGYFLGRYVFKMPFLKLVGVLSGGLTTSFGLMAIVPKTNSEIPRNNYAKVYPFGLVLMIIISQLMAIIIK